MDPQRLYAKLHQPKGLVDEKKVLEELLITKNFIYDFSFLIFSNMTKKEEKKNYQRMIDSKISLNKIH